MSIKVLLLCGGDGAEHDISLLSADYVEQEVKKAGFDVLRATLHEKKFVVRPGNFGHFDEYGRFCHQDGVFAEDCVIPCIHGTPGEDGSIQNFLEHLDIPYIGCDPQASAICLNKVMTKYYLTQLGIPNTPYVSILSQDERSRQQAEEFFAAHGNVFVKAASQGSSVGCYHVRQSGELWDAVCRAFSYSNAVIIEQFIPHRELEVAAYEYNGGLVTTAPSEIVVPESGFYDYEQKYSSSSATRTEIRAAGISEHNLHLIEDYARRAFTGLRLRDLSRIDFFESRSGEILVNEINTFPGMTAISMFPKMLINHGDDIGQFFAQAIKRAVSAKGRQA